MTSSPSGNPDSTRENGIETARLLQNMPGKKGPAYQRLPHVPGDPRLSQTRRRSHPMPVPDVWKAAEHWNARFPAFEVLVVESAKIVDYKLHGWI